MLRVVRHDHLPAFTILILDLELQKVYDMHTSAYMRIRLSVRTQASCRKSQSHAGMHLLVFLRLRYRAHTLHKIRCLDLHCNNATRPSTVSASMQHQAVGARSALLCATLAHTVALALIYTCRYALFALHYCSLCADHIIGTHIVNPAFFGSPPRDGTLATWCIQTSQTGHRMSHLTLRPKMYPQPFWWLRTVYHRMPE